MKHLVVKPDSKGESLIVRGRQEQNADNDHGRTQERNPHDYSLATKQLEERKKDKERFIVAVCCNGDGSDKVPLWVIGIFANPRCFKHVNIDNLSCHYRAIKKEWMTGLLFQDFVRWFGARMTGRKVLLIVDNCPAYPKEDMPLEQEIDDVEGIHKLKEVISDLHYRNAMDVERILNYPSENESLVESTLDEEIIQGVMDVPADDEQDPDKSSVLPHVSPKKAFLAVDTLKNYLIQHKKNIPD
ncbi:uncharacterized protein LOC105793415 [Gossypium raimondii]|uniref:uncharacterized protein LOC105793415 n=1 Tax=Gossypium raimondii TaxID=29730 RepID=UPI00063AAECA|nr:uncharacterized protein LOC105793415 [Gossypium raimondii]